MAEESSSDKDFIEVKCPECGAVVRVPLEKAEREMRAQCLRGHDVPLVKALF
jgi:RNase P subunit RPR2